MTVHTNQLLWIKVATNVRNIFPQEHKADVDGRKKALVWSLKQFHVCYYWLYKKGMTCAMVGLHSLHSGHTLKHPTISAGIGLKSFCPWCLKLGGNTEMITIHLCEVHYQLAIACDICQVFAAWLHRTFQTISWSAKRGMTKSTWSAMPLKHTERLRSHKAQKSQRKHLNCRDRREHLSHSGQVSVNWSKMLPRNHAEWNATFCLPLFLLTPIQPLQWMNTHSVSEWFHILFPDGPTSHFLRSTLTQSDELSHPFS